MASMVSSAILFGQVLLFGGVLQVSGAITSQKLDCSGIIESSTLDAYKSVCHYVESPEKASLDYEIENRLDILEQCTCNLLRHSLAWQALLTHEVESMYLAVRALVDSRPEEPETALLADRSNVMFNQDENEGNYMYFWDRFNSIIRTTEVETDGEDLSIKYMLTFAANYYNPNTLKMTYKKVTKAPTNTLRSFISNQCEDLLKKFGYFFGYFTNLGTLSKNPRYIYRVLTYDEALFKIYATMYMCKFLHDSGELTQ